jgi:hypothetical protein
MEKEAAFSDIAVRAAAGEISEQVLDQERHELMGLRALCTEVYAKAFPNAQGQ